MGDCGIKAVGNVLHKLVWAGYGTSPKVVRVRMGPWLKPDQSVVSGEDGVFSEALGARRMFLWASSSHVSCHEETE